MKTLPLPFLPFLPATSRPLPAFRPLIARKRQGAVAVGGKEVSAAARVMHLKQGEVIRVDRASGISGVEVEAGLIWATDTPASGDFLLGPGGNLGMQDRWPVVLQAMTESVIRFS